MSIKIFIATEYGPREMTLWTSELRVREGGYRGTHEYDDGFEDGHNGDWVENWKPCFLYRDQALEESRKICREKANQIIEDGFKVFARAEELQ